MGGQSFWLTIPKARIDVHSEVPAVPVAAVLPVPRVPRAESGGGGFTQSARILIVDDVDTNRQLLRSYLADCGFELGAASGGAQALDGSGPAEPTWLLTDLKMPGMNGRELLQAIRGLEDSGLRGIPVIAITAAAMPDAWIRNGACSMDSCSSRCPGRNWSGDWALPAHEVSGEEGTPESVGKGCRAGRMALRRAYETDWAVELEAVRKHLRTRQAMTWGNG
jgi:CheY-like chemotaxis protein